jgi:hypothetical protein
MSQRPKASRAIAEGLARARLALILGAAIRRPGQQRSLSIDRVPGPRCARV